MIVDGEVPDVLRDATMYALDLGALVAGTKLSRRFREAAQIVLASCARSVTPSCSSTRFTAIIGAGAASGGVMDASNLIKPMLASGEMKCIGSTTYQEYRGIFEKDRALARASRKSTWSSHRSRRAIRSSRA